MKVKTKLALTGILTATVAIGFVTPLGEDRMSLVDEFMWAYVHPLPEHAHEIEAGTMNADGEWVKFADGELGLIIRTGLDR